MTLRRLFFALDDVRVHVQFKEHTHQPGDIIGFVRTPPVILRERLARSLNTAVRRSKQALMTVLRGRLWTKDEGQDIAEYAVMLAVILVLVVGTIRLVGSNANNAFPAWRVGRTSL